MFEGYTVADFRSLILAKNEAFQALENANRHLDRRRYAHRRGRADPVPVAWPARRAELAELLALELDYVPLAKGASSNVFDRVNALGLTGLQVETRPGRMCPHKTLAAHVLGFVNVDGDAAYGLECHYDRELSGRDGSRAT